MTTAPAAHMSARPLPALAVVSAAATRLLPALEVVSARELRPGDVIWSNGFRRYQIVTPRDETGRAMIDVNGLIVPFNAEAYTVQREPLQVSWRNMYIVGVLNQPTMSLEETRVALAAAFDRVSVEAVEENAEKWGKVEANEKWQKAKGA
jgi:hypothetical protein